MIRQVEGRGPAEVRRLATLQLGNIVREHLIADAIGRGASSTASPLGPLAVMFRRVYLARD